MKKFITIIFALFALVSCIEEVESPVLGGTEIKDGYMTIDFGHKNFGNIEISTRSTVSTAAEDAVINIYLLMFDAAGNRVLGEFFDRTKREDTENALDAATENKWWVDNKDSGAVEGSANYGTTRGSIKIKAPNSLTNGKIYLIANLDPAIFNLTDEKLNFVKSEADLHKLALNFNQESTSRTGNLLMLGYTSINIANNQLNLGVDGSIPLVRVDSKIEVKVGIVPGAVTTKYVKDENGKDTDVVESTQEIESFTPTSWRVVNLPKDTWLMPRGNDVVAGAVDAKKEGGYFNSATHLFETKEQDDYNKDNVDDRTLHGFSFYMVESYPDDADKMGIGDKNYHDRDKRKKNQDGTYMFPEASDEDIWVYAPKDAAYLVVEGEVQMKVNEESTEGQTLNALVRYYIHLGDFGTDVNNYDVVRNTHYIYTINIKGVDKIEVEVERDNDPKFENIDNEVQSGATGEVYIAQQEIYTFDAHYGQRVYTFNFAAMLHTIGMRIEDNTYVDKDGNVLTKDNEEAIEEIVNSLTWYVSTPFGRKGSPDIVNGGIEVPAGLDYKWVYFLKNGKESDAAGDEINVYKKTGQWYPGDSQRGLRITDPNSSAYGETLMDVSALCTYLREQITKRALNQENDFDDEDNLVFTAFVDEFYYEVDPIAGVSTEVLWHSFVNQPMRMMHILCSAEASKDGESSATGSVVTIRQRSIQTVYNLEAATEAWGVETVDEVRAPGNSAAAVDRRTLGFYSTTSNAVPDNNPYVGNKTENGLYNSVRVWGFSSNQNHSVSIVNEDNHNHISKNGAISWDTYLDYERVKDHVISNGSSDVIIDFLKPDYANLRYSCLMRNRDNDGDGIIDKDEIRWYMASTQQLSLLFIGEYGIDSNSKLYNIESVNTGSSGNGYLCHVISSTAENTSSMNPLLIWAEEGLSVGKYSTGSANLVNSTVRCVRNLPSNSSTEYDLNDSKDMPKSPVRAKRVVEEDQVFYQFDFSDLNDASKRIKVESELVPSDQNANMSQLYKAFETGYVGNDDNVLINAGSVGDEDSGNNYNHLIRSYLVKGFSYCPPGYRMPNIREGAIMRYFVDDDVDDDGNDDASVTINVNGSVRTYDVTDDFWKGATTRWAVCSYFSLGPYGFNYDSYNARPTWTYSSPDAEAGGVTGITIAGGDDRYIRCIRDIEPSEIVQN